MNQEEFDGLGALLSETKKKLDTLELVQSEAYDAAVREHLMVNDQVDYSLLNQSSVQEVFADSYNDRILTAAKSALGVTEDKGPLENAMLVKGYTGMNPDKILVDLAERGENYTKQAHSNIITRVKREQEVEYKPALFENFKIADIGDAVGHMGVGEYVNASRLDRANAIALIQQYFQTGLTRTMVENKPFYIP
tara:strand:+ start:337 stop:918 length:582 start_codon:yes stop_codon:yes gene_type:complete